MSKIKEQYIPLLLTVITCGILFVLLYAFLTFLNLFPSQEKIHIVLRKRDIFIGLSIYLKTSVDFALFIGNLMKSNPGWKKRIAIEGGTAVGNALGTLLVLTLWTFFKEIPLLMAGMILIASFVLLQMARDSLDEFLKSTPSLPQILLKPIGYLELILTLLNKVVSSITRFIVPDIALTKMKTIPWKQLVFFSFSIPFILGLDDFAGYIPLFSIVNVFGFATGVLLGHMLLTSALFVSPTKTVQIVRLPVILALGGLAFVGIALWGFYEAAHLLITLY